MGQWTAAPHPQHWNSHNKSSSTSLPFSLHKEILVKNFRIFATVLNFGQQVVQFTKNEEPTWLPPCTPAAKGFYVCHSVQFDAT